METCITKIYSFRLLSMQIVTFSLNYFCNRMIIVNLRKKMSHKSSTVHRKQPGGRVFGMRPIGGSVRHHLLFLMALADLWLKVGTVASAPQSQGQSDEGVERSGGEVARPCRRHDWVSLVCYLTSGLDVACCDLTVCCWWRKGCVTLSFIPLSPHKKRLLILVLCCDLILCSWRERVW